MQSIFSKYIASAFALMITQASFAQDVCFPQINGEARIVADESDETVVGKMHLSVLMLHECPEADSFSVNGSISEEGPFGGMNTLQMFSDGNKVLRFFPGSYVGIDMPADPDFDHSKTYRLNVTFSKIVNTQTVISDQSFTFQVLEDGTFVEIQ